MSRPIQALIDKSALRHNLNFLRQKAGDRFMWAVIKADAYGHGMRKLLDVFDLADGVAVLDISEAVDARKLGWTKPILLIEGFFSAGDLPIVDSENLETLVHSNWQIEELKRYQSKNRIKLHVKVNSGMNRLGFMPDMIQSVLNQLRDVPNTEVVDLVTHFANSEINASPDVAVPVSKQLSRMQSIKVPYKPCFSNSGAILWHDEVHDHAVRAGIAMYGVSPDMDVTSEELNLKPVMTLRSGILAIQNLAVGEATGYGSKFVATRPTKIAIIACGYADGYPRQVVENREVFVKGQRAKVVGGVSMDMIAIDVTDIPNVAVGDWVELWGNNIPVNEVAGAHATIGYELLANLNWRVERIYLDLD